MNEIRLSHRSISTQGKNAQKRFPLNLVASVVFHNQKGYISFILVQLKVIEIYSLGFSPRLLKEAHNSFFGIGVDLFKSISRMEDLLRFPSYFTNFSTYDQILCFSWFPSNSCYHSNGDAKHFVLDNADFLEI